MKISPINCGNVHYLKNVQKMKYAQKPVEQPIEQPSFRGAKGAAIGVGAGLLWSGVILGMCAIGAPYLVPFMAGEVIVGGVGAGTIAGHFMENDLKE